MTHNGLEIAIPREDEIDALDAVLSPALHFSPGLTREFVGVLGRESFRAARLSGRVVAGLGLIRMGQWYGSARVPLAGITAVGVAPDMRGAGIGSALLKRTLEDLRVEGLPLAALYPATLPYYQRAGFERAGQRVTYELPLAAIDSRDRSLELVPFGPDDYDQMRQVYQRRAGLVAGNLDRPEWMWRDRFEPRDKQAFRYRAAHDGVTEGYIVYTQGGRNDPLMITDVCVLSAAAGRRLLALLAGYRSMVDKVVWSGGPLDPLVYLLAEQLSAGQRNTAAVLRSLDWVLRIVDVVRALAARGYPPGLSAELHLDVYDDLLPANAGRWVLAVSGGHGEVQPGGAGRIQVHVRDLAAIYSGFLSPQECVYLGTIAGPEEDLALAGAIFGGPRPWIADMF
jgi:predicted acetyltransferase